MTMIMTATLSCRSPFLRPNQEIALPHWQEARPKLRFANRKSSFGFSTKGKTFCSDCRSFEDKRFFCKRIGGSSQATVPFDINPSLDFRIQAYWAWIFKY